jgi:hypothetical protein
VIALVVIIAIAASAVLSILLTRGGLPPGWKALYDTRGNSFGQAVYNISCPSPDFCMAGATNGTTYEFMNGHWARGNIIDRFPDPFTVPLYPEINGVSCVSSAYCVATDLDGHVYVMRRGSWGQPTTVFKSRPGILYLYPGFDAISCWSIGHCLAATDTGLYTTGANGHWMRAASILGPQSGEQVNAISCTRRGVCYLVTGGIGGGGGGVGFVYRYRDGVVHRAPPVLLDSSLESISCPSAIWCVAVDSSGNALELEDGMWSKPAHVTSGDESFTSVSCAAVERCVAVGDQGRAYDLLDGHWSAGMALTPGAYPLEAISCADVRACVAAGGSVSYELQR